MMDVNQCWDVFEVVEWMFKLVKFKLLWIEELIFFDDILGYVIIFKVLVLLGIGIVIGEQCYNRVIFK